MKKRDAAAQTVRRRGIKEISGDGRLIIRLFLTAAAGALLSSGRFLFGSYPFAAAFLTAVSGEYSVPAAVAGAAVGCAFVPGGTAQIPVLLSLFIGRLIIGLILSSDEEKPVFRRGDKIFANAGRFFGACAAVRYDESVYIRMVLSSVSSLAGGMLIFAAGGSAGFVPAIAASVTSPLLVWLFASSPAWEKIFPDGARKTRDRLLSEAGTTALAATLTLSFYAIRIPVVNLGAVCAFAVTVGTVRRRDLLHGMLRGFVCGAVMSPSLAPTFAAVAIVSGILSKIADTGSVAAGGAAGIFWSLWANGLGTLTDVIPEIIVGVTVMTPVCAFGILPLSDAGRRVMRRRGPGVADRAIRERTGKRLADLSESFSSVSRELYKMAEEINAPSREELVELCDGALKGVCAGCGLRHACYETEPNAIKRLREEMADRLLDEGRVGASVVTKSLSKRCYNVDRIIDSVNAGYARRIAEAKIFDRTAVVASDYEAMAEMLGEVARSDSEEFRPDAETTERLVAELPSRGFIAESVAVFGERRKKVIATGVRLTGTALGADQIRSVFGELCGAEFGEPTFSIDGERVNMELDPTPPLSAEYGEASEPAAQEGRNALCGDVIKTFGTDDGRFYMLISDGMGSGKEASLTAGMCAIFLERMLTSGASVGAALRMLNSMVRVRGAECSATVDLMEVDLLKGVARFVKSGAAPSFVVRDGRLFRIQSKTVPIGIIRALDAEMITFDISPGDVLVMLSDGVARSFEEAPWLCDYLSERSDGSTAETAREIVRLAVENGSRDDVTAGVVRISAKR